MTIECRIPISPTPAFLYRVILFAASIRRFYPDTIVRAYIGEAGGPKPDSVQRVTNAFSGHRIGIEWIGRTEFDAWESTRSPFLATMNRRFKTPIDGDHVMILDADVLMTGPIDELLTAHAVQGVQAHVDPIGIENWKHVFRGFVHREPLFLFPYTGNGIMGPYGTIGPWYPNSGMVIAPRELFQRLCDPYHTAISYLRGRMPDTYWFDQLALALAAAKADVPLKGLSLRYNFPNQREFDREHRDELADVRFIHYLRTDVVDRDREFDSLLSLREFSMYPDLYGSNERLRTEVASLMHVLEPAPLSCAEDAPYA